jgi:hypothetical protein
MTTYFAVLKSVYYSNSQPCGASPALPGDNEKLIAVRASAATI